MELSGFLREYGMYSIEYGQYNFCVLRSNGILLLMSPFVVLSVCLSVNNFNLAITAVKLLLLSGSSFKFLIYMDVSFGRCILCDKIVDLVTFTL